MTGTNDNVEGFPPQGGMVFEYKDMAGTTHYKCVQNNGDMDEYEKQLAITTLTVINAVDSLDDIKYHNIH